MMSKCEPSEEANSVYTYAGTWCRNRGSRARAHGDSAAIAMAHLAVVGERVGKRVMIQGDVKGADNFVYRAWVKGECGLSRSRSLSGCCVVYR